MTGNKIDELELAALLCSRVCHDVISPVGAIINGLEVLDEGDDDEMSGFAMDLIRKSASQASSKLQFARLAFGAAGSAGASIDLSEAAEVAKRFANDDKTTLNWEAVPVAMPKDYVKIALNMVLVAISSIPRSQVERSKLTMGWSILLWKGQPIVTRENNHILAGSNTQMAFSPLLLKQKKTQPSFQ